MEVFEFYRSVFGGEFQYVGKFKEMPPHPDYPVSEGDMERIMHISLPISDGSTLMGSDSSEAFGIAGVVGNNVSISINTKSVDEITRIYDALTIGGKIKMPLNKTFWGSYFGQFIDKFGIYWMVNCELEEHKDFEKDNKPR